MDVDLLQTLQVQFGFTDFRPGQRDAIERLLAGKSVATVFPTGAGKSLCFQLPAMLFPGVTLVVSPLIALMKDQIDALQTRGIAAQRLDSTLSGDEYRDVMQQVRSGKLRLLYVAPERFQNERFREAMQRVQVSLFAVDEAHCISEWGHNFRPDYLKLAEYARQFRAERVLALTATATPQVLADMCRAFGITSDCAVRTGFFRPNLWIRATQVSAAERDGMLARRLGERNSGPTIVYVTLQRTAEEVAQRLVSAGFPAKAYHAGMEDDARAAVQDWFLKSRAGIVVATIAFGMGIDKSDIRAVYHFNLPKSLENYSQEIGRAGRDGEPAICEMFVCLDDLNSLENFAYGDTPTRSAIGSLVEEIFDAGEAFEVSYYDLAQQHDIRILVVRTLLTYLELDGYLEAGTPFYSSYRFQPLKTSAEILGRFEGERREFLDRLFRQAKKSKTWFTIDVDGASRTLAAPRDRVVRALDYLADQGLLELKTEGVRNPYRRRQVPRDRAALADDLRQRMLQREARELQRLQQVLELIQERQCHMGALCRHFGEDLSNPCGHCTWCEAKEQLPKLPPRPVFSIPRDILQQAQALRRKYPDRLNDATVLTRLLCGLSSPHLTRAKLTSDPLFGALAHVPFAQVREACGG